MRRETLDNMCRLQHRCRYLPADLALLGGRVAEVEVGHAARAKGISKYNFLKLVRAAGGRAVIDRIQTVRPNVSFEQGFQHGQRLVTLKQPRLRAGPHDLRPTRAAVAPMFERNR